MKSIAFVFGTRPEIIKLAPILLAAKSDKHWRPLLISSGQHREMAQQALDLFGLQPDISLELMEPGQSPQVFLARALEGLERALQQLPQKPNLLVVQGDTSTTLAGALAGFHRLIPVAHLEAGLRTFDPHSPFPEEMNRTLVSRLASYHFCPTETAKENLRLEGIRENVFVIGNTVVDALHLVDDWLAKGQVQASAAIAPLLRDQRPTILVTGHRRENFDKPIRNLCQILRAITKSRPEVQIIYPVHLNPNILQPVQEELSTVTNIHLVEPLSYIDLLILLKRATLCITDSGGIQEEAPSFATPTLVTRRLSERPEGLEQGFASLLDLENINQATGEVIEVLDSASARRASLQARPNPYGDGKSSARFFEILRSSFS